MELKNLLQSKKSTYLFYVIGGLIVALVIFQAGVFVGFKKASFSNRWGESYRETFGGRHRRMGISDFYDDYSNSHGAVGKIIKLELPKLIIIGKDNVEKIILTKDDTTIRLFRNEVKTTDLKLNDYIVVIGSPNNIGEIEAKLIRLMPVEMMMATGTSQKK